jgi:hypothetical protein
MGRSEHLAGRLAPKFSAVNVDERDHGVCRRSSSAWAKYANALRKWTEWFAVSLRSAQAHEHVLRASLGHTRDLRNAERARSGGKQKMLTHEDPGNKTSPSFIPDFSKKYKARQLVVAAT